MALYRVCFIRNDEYDVEASDENEAIDKAYKEFDAERDNSTYIDNHYDECKVELLDDDEKE